MKIFCVCFGMMIVMLGIWVEVGTAQDPPPDPSTWMPDANLRAAVLARLKIFDIIEDDATTFTQDNMKDSKFTSLVEFVDEKITDLTGLNYAIHLTNLSLTGNSISDISVVSDLTQLEWLYLNSNNISNISVVSGLTNLTRLNLSSNNISDISAVSGLTQLEWLFLSSNNISDISAVSELTNLTVLNLDSNNISDISAVSELTDLTSLSLGFNRISDISAVSKLTNLTYLVLIDNNISDISAVSGLTNLIQLYLSRNRISSTDELLGLTKLERLSLDRNRIRDVNEFLKLASLSNLNFLDLDGRGTNNLQAVKDGNVNALRNYLYVPPSLALLPKVPLPPVLYVPPPVVPPPVTVTFENYPEKPPTDEFTLTIRFSEAVTGFEAEDITVETELKRGTGTATLEALTLIGRTEQTNDAEEIVVFAQTYFARIKLPPNVGGTVRLIIHQGSARIASGRIAPTTQTASEPIEFRRKGPLVFPSYVAMDKVIFNEFRNAEDDTHDWVELKNISDKEVPLKDYEISMVASEGEHRNTDRDIVDFPDWTLPPDGILLILNTDPAENDLLRGQNIENPNHTPKLRPWYLIRPDMKLPDTPYLLILRSARDKNGTYLGFEDLVGDYHRGDVNYRTQIWPLRDTWVYTGTGARLSEAEAWQRLMRPKGVNPMQPMERGYFHDAWVASEYQSGLGYDPDASPETSLGTPGYATLIADDIGTGHLSFSEVMFATDEKGSPSEWIELYNPSATEVIDLDGWQLVLEGRDSQTAYHYTQLRLKPLKVMPNQTVLLVARNERNSGNIPNPRIYNISRRNRQMLRLGTIGQKLLGSEGFALRLFSADGMLVDMAGNLNGKQGVDKPRWQLPSGWSESGKRSSLIRRYEDRLPAQGTRLGSWVRAADTTLLMGYSYWGLPTDGGTPGYRQGSPLPVEVSSMRADLREGCVSVTWTTASEMENAGFHVLRCRDRGSGFVRINPALIPGAGTTAEGQTYTYRDTMVQLNVPYYYRLEEVSLSGERRAVATVRLRGHVSAANKVFWKWANLKAQD